MSHLRAGRGGEHRRSVFNTHSAANASAAASEDWELVEPPPKEGPEQKGAPPAHRRTSPSPKPLWDPI